MAIEINAVTRTDLGKGASRRLRHQEKLPAIIYGAGSDPVNLTIDQREVRPFIDNELFYASIVSLKVDGKAEDVIVRDMQHHPFKIDVMHIDFQRVDAKQKMHINVPVHFLNEDTCPGVKQEGGLVSHILTEVEIECLPKSIPEFIAVDMANMKTGDSIHLTELVMPKGVELMALKHGDEDHDTVVVSIHAPKVISEDDEEAAEGGSEEAPATEE